jgi:uncharacterized phage protein (TIGR02220 family)
MADQGIWFKLWCSALDDPHLDNLELCDFARWAKLGALIKRQGQAGSLTLTPPGRAVCAMLQVDDFAALLAAISRLPHVQMRRHNSAVSSETDVTVSFENWAKYQGDFSTHRVMKFRELKRFKRRREEIRRESTTTLSRGDSLEAPPERRERRETACRLIDFLNQKTGRSYRKVEATLRLIIARLEAGATEANCRGVIARKVREWHGTEMAKYLRPETLFNRTKFESYLGERTAEVAHADVSPVQ